MNRKGAFVIGAALLFGSGLTTVLLGADLQTARAGDATYAMPDQPGNTTTANAPVQVDWAASPGRHGQTKITGHIHNNSGTPVDHVQLAISELDASGRVVSRVFQTVDDVIPYEGYFDVQVPTSSSYRVDVERYDTPQWP